MTYTNHSIICCSYTSNPVTRHYTTLHMMTSRWMAGLRLSPSDCFNFKKPGKWHSWKCHFEQFCLALGLSSEDNKREISTLLYCLGKDTEALVSTDITRKKYKDVLEVRKNTIFENARFNRHNYQEGESAEQYITVLTSYIVQWTTVIMVIWKYTNYQR